MLPIIQVVVDFAAKLPILYMDTSLAMVLDFIKVTAARNRKVQTAVNMAYLTEINVPERLHQNTNRKGVPSLIFFHHLT